MLWVWLSLRFTFTFPSCKISCTVRLVCQVAEDTALKSCYGDADSWERCWDWGWSPVNFWVVKPERLPVGRMMQWTFLQSPREMLCYLYSPDPETIFISSLLYWHVQIPLSFLEKKLATGRAFGSFLCLCLKSFAILWHELGSKENNLGKMARPYNLSIMALGRCLLIWAYTTATPDPSHVYEAYTVGLTHWVSPGIEPASSWILIEFITAELQQGCPAVPFWDPAPPGPLATWIGTQMKSGSRTGEIWGKHVSHLLPSGEFSESFIIYFIFYFLSPSLSFKSMVAETICISSLLYFPYGALSRVWWW